MQANKSVNDARMTTGLQQIWDWLTAPFHTLPHRQEIHRVRALAALILSQIVFGAIILIYIAIAHPGSFAELAGISLAFVIDVPIYLLSRTRHYRLAAALHTGLILLAVIPLIASPDADVSSHATYFLILSVLVASMFLSRRVAFGIAGIGGLAAILLPIIQPDSSLFSPAHVLFIAFATSIVLVESYLHDRAIAHITRQTAALTASELRYRSVMETTFDAMLLHNNGIITSTNDGFSRVFGYTVEEVVGRPMWQFFFTKEGEPLSDSAQFLEAKKPAPLVARHKTGRLMDVELVTSGFDYEDYPLHVVAIREITHIRQAERIRHEDDLRYRALFEQTNDLVILVGLDRRIIAVNQQACNTLGYPEHHLVGEEYSIIRLAAGDAGSAQTLQRLFSNEKMAFHEQTLLKKDGTALPVEVNIVLVRDADGKPSHIQYIARDTTERKIAERERLENELQYRALFEQTTDGVTLFDLNGKIIAMNPQSAEMLGNNVDEQLGQSVDSAVIEGEREASQAMLRRLLAGEQVANYERTFRHKNGSEIHVEINASLVHDADGNPSHIQSILRDITSRKAAEIKRRQDEARYRALFEQTNDMVFIIGLDGRLLTANQQGLDALGYTAEEYIGTQIVDMGPPGDKPRREGVLKRLFAGEKIPTYEITYHRKDGTTFPVETNVTLVYDADGNPSHIQAISRDISERKDAERKQREDEARYRALFEQSNDLIALIGLDTRVIDANQQLLAMTGFTHEEIIGHSLSHIAPQNDDERRVSRIQRLLKGERLPAHEMVMYRKDGTAFPVEVNASLVYDADGKPSHVQSIIRDITERKESERKQREDDARYRALFEQTNDMVFLMSLDSMVLDVNQQGASALNYRVDELIGQPVTLIANPHGTEADHRVDIISRLKAGEVIPTYEHDFYRKDGSSFTAEVTVALVHDSHGNPTHIQSVIRDITERKAAERQQQEDAVRYRALFDQSNDMVYLVDLDLNIITANKQALQTFGYTAEEIHNLPLEAIVPTDEIGKTMRTRDRMLAGEKIPIYERIFVKKNGERFAAEVNVALVYDVDGNPRHFQSISRDITDRKQAQARYRALFDQSRDAVFIVSLRDYLVMVNPQAAEMTGYTIGELLQLQYDELVIESERAASQVIFDRLKEGQLLPVYERTFRRKTGDHFPVEINAVLVRDTDGNPLHIQCVVRDITERKRAQGHQIDLAIARERVHVLQEFIDHASHDFGTPITNIKTSLYLLRKAANNPKKLEEYIERLETHANRLERLLGDLLAMSRLEKDSTGKMRYARLNVNMLIREVAARQANVITAQGHELNLELADDLPLILADKMALSDAFTEILENAAIYTESGGTITIRSEKDDDAVQIEFQDTGIGIQPGDLERIFNSFYRADTARSTDTGGTGLGLAIAKKIIETHDGSITVTSTPGEGSTFIVRLRALITVETKSESLDSET